MLSVVLLRMRLTMSNSSDSHSINLYNFEFGSVFVDMTSRIWVTKETAILDFINVWNFCRLKNIFKNVNKTTPFKTGKELW